MSQVTSLLTVWLYLFEDEVITVGLGGRGGGAVNPVVVPDGEPKVEDDFGALSVPLLYSSWDGLCLLNLPFPRARRSLRKEGMARVACLMIEDSIGDFAIEVFDGLFQQGNKHEVGGRQMSDKG